MAEVFTQKYIIDYSMCDRFNEWRLDALLGMLTATSTMHNNTHISPDSELYDKYLWVVTQHDIRVNHLPQLGDEITVSTELWGYNHYFCYRSYEVTDVNGKEIIHIETTYTLVDKDKRKIVRVPEEYIQDYKTEYIGRNKDIVRLPKKITPTHSEERRTRYSDLDSNGHVGNAVYGRWLLDEMGLVWLEKYNYRRIVINYDHEILDGEPVHIERTDPEFIEGVSVTNHQINNEQQTFAKFRIEWTKR
ncbi:MAG: thioesterase [Aerococcus sp.]|nr:thioesterase [Aerococcus sp.]